MRATRVVAGLLLPALLLSSAPAEARVAKEPWPIVLEGGPPPHPAAHWGRLENGLRWVVLPVAKPEGAASLRLLVEVGSRHEREDERGIAHLLEHMAFRGSAGLAPGELAASLARFGAAMGPDTNARTGFDATVYQLELPRAAPDALEHGLFVLREIADRLTIPAELLEIERGVVLAEARQRDGPGQRAFAESLAFLLPESGLAERLPIGDPEVVARADRPLVEGFYRRWYRPERMVVAVAGSVEPGEVGERIARLFADLEAGGPAPQEPVPPPLAERGLELALRIEPGLPAAVSVAFRHPPELRPDGLEVRRDGLIDGVALRALGERLSRLAAGTDPELTSPRVGIDEWDPVARLVRLRAGIEPERAEAALRTLGREVARLSAHGVSAGEVEEALAMRRSALEDRLRTAPTRLSRSRVEVLVAAARDRRAFLDEAGALTLFERLAPAIDAPTVSDRARALVAGEPLIEVTLPAEPADGLEAARERLLAAWRAGRAEPVEPPRFAPAPQLAYGPDPEPAPPVAREHVPDLDLYAVQFANGVRLDVKPTEFEADTVRLTVRFGRGRLGLPPDRPGLDLLARHALLAGGLGRHPAEELDRILAGRRLTLGFTLAEAASLLTVEAGADELETALVLARAWLEDPGLRAEGLVPWRRALETTWRRLASVARATLEGPVERLLHRGDPRFGLPARELAEARTLDELAEWWRGETASGPLDVAIVGAVEPERAIEAVARTLGRLPPRVEAETPPPPPPWPAGAETVVVEHGGPSGQAILLVHLATDDARDQRRAEGLALLADVLRERLRARIRETLGASYAPQVSSFGSFLIPGRGAVRVVVDLPADRARALARLVEAEIDRLAAEGPRAEELAQVLPPRRVRAERALRSNGFWLERVLTGRHRAPERLEHARTLSADIASLDAASLAALARTYLVPERRLTVLVLPEGQG
ncbi:MAG: insulinase family protein [Geminicoccaceae bacterium]|nr:insulinase family protein [Geminicoccaceae bacterium]